MPIIIIHQPLHSTLGRHNNYHQVPLHTHTPPKTARAMADPAPAPHSGGWRGTDGGWGGTDGGWGVTDGGWG